MASHHRCCCCCLKLIRSLADAVVQFAFSVMDRRGLAVDTANGYDIVLALVYVRVLLSPSVSKGLELSHANHSCEVALVGLHHLRSLTAAPALFTHAVDIGTQR